MKDKLNKKIEKRLEKGTLRSLSSFKGLVDFFSNDYLGLARIEENIVGRLGSSGSRLISGNSENIENIEGKVAKEFGFEAGLVFNSGYDANVGVFSSLPQKGDVILYDEFIHASVRDGIRLSFATSFSFRHNDVSHLKKLLGKCDSNSQVYIAVESLYSMNGDLAPLKEIEKLSKETSSFLIVDEAHAVGVFGNEGKGLCEEFKVVPDLLLLTFGKAIGAHGAIVLTTSKVQNFLVNFARSFIYTTALPELIIVHACDRLLTDNLMERERLFNNISSFRMKFKHHNIVSSEISPIQVLTFDNVLSVQKLESELLHNGIAIKAIYPPTVPEGTACLRICLHAFNTEAEIQKLTLILSK